eukprot:scaffold113208_cov18-Tisochrysis_lutea.AAC.1
MLKTYRETSSKTSSQYGRIPHQWDEETYGKLLEIGGGKERMTAYFSFNQHEQALSNDGQTHAPSCPGKEDEEPFKSVK